MPPQAESAAYRCEGALDLRDRMVVTEASGPGGALTPRGPTQEVEAPMPDNRNTGRKYRMIRLGAGDYLLPSNDAQVLWRLRTYEETGDAENWQGRKVVGTFWAVWRWDGGFPTPDQLAAAFEADDWTRWEFWAGPFGTRNAAIEEALHVRS